MDLSDVTLDDEDAFWSAVASPLALPTWFGRNLAAWNDTLFTGGISDVVDAYDEIVFRVREEGLFAPDNPRGRQLIEVTTETGRGRVETVDRS